MAGTAAPVVLGAIAFEALYRPLLGLWAVGGCRAVTVQLPHIPVALAAMADAVCRKGRVHPLLGNTLVRPAAVSPIGPHLGACSSCPAALRGIMHSQ